jgi:sigma-B regulation protein RsbU (phosphoserine phosphatase)
MAIRYLPFGQVSGDLYDFSLNGDGALNVFLGDATGHGIGAAFMTMMVQTGLDSIGPDQPVDATLTRLHTLIHERAGDRFVTGVYLRMTPDGTATHASAGHPPIVFVPREGEARQLEDDAGLPLGLLDTPLPFAPEVVTLRAGDRLFLYTDGLTEWARVDGEQYSAERLTRYVAEHRALPLEACLGGLLEDARSFAAGASDTDDVTVIALEYTP